MSVSIKSYDLSLFMSVTQAAYNLSRHSVIPVLPQRIRPDLVDTSGVAPLLLVAASRLDVKEANDYINALTVIGESVSRPKLLPSPPGTQSLQVAINSRQLTIEQAVEHVLSIISTHLTPSDLFGAPAAVLNFIQLLGEFHTAAVIYNENCTSD